MITIIDDETGEISYFYGDGLRSPRNYKYGIKSSLKEVPLTTKEFRALEEIFRKYGTEEANNYIEKLVEEMACEREVLDNLLAKIQ